MHEEYFSILLLVYVFCLILLFLLLLMLSYHRLTEMLELCMEGGRVNHTWCIGVVSHGYGGLGGGSGSLSL